MNSEISINSSYKNEIIIIITISAGIYNSTYRPDLWQTQGRSGMEPNLLLTEFKIL